MSNNQINVFVNDAHNTSIPDASISAFDGDEEIGRVTPSPGRNLPARFTLPEQIAELRLVVSVAGFEPQEKTVRADVGNVTFIFEKSTPPNPDPKPGQEKEKSKDEGKGKNDEPGGGMEVKLLGTLGKIAGLAGLSLGAVLLIFQNVLKQKLIPTAGLSPDQAFHIILAILILTFGIAAIGIVAWIVEKVSTPTKPVSRTALGMLVFLVVAVLLSSIAVAADSPFLFKPSSSTDKKPENVPAPTVSPAPKITTPTPPQNKVAGAGAKSKSSAAPPVESRTGDKILDKVKIDLARIHRSNGSDAQLEEAISPLFGRAAFMCATTEDWRALLWVVISTRFVIQDSLQSFRRDGADRVALMKAMEILRDMEASIKTLYVGTDWGKLDEALGNEAQFEQTLKRSKDPDAAIDNARINNVNKLRNVLGPRLSINTEQCSQSWRPA